MNFINKIFKERLTDKLNIKKRYFIRSYFCKKVYNLDNITYHLYTIPEFIDIYKNTKLFIRKRNYLVGENYRLPFPKLNNRE